MSVRKNLHERMDDADAACARWLADGNEHREAGRVKSAERCYERSQRWLDRFNELRYLHTVRTLMATSKEEAIS